MLERVREGLDEIEAGAWMWAKGRLRRPRREDKDWINNWKEFFHQFYVDDILIKPSGRRYSRRIGTSF